MTEPRPVYTDDSQSPARRALLSAAALDNARAAAAWLDALASYARILIATASNPAADDRALTVAFNEAHGLNLAAAALAAGIDMREARQ